MFDAEETKIANHSWDSHPFQAHGLPANELNSKGNMKGRKKDKYLGTHQI